MTAIIIILGLILFLGFLAISFKNKFVILLSRVKNAWSQIDVQLQRRFDLIPNLVETVKGYATHEKGTLESCHCSKKSIYSSRNCAGKNGGK